MLPRSLLLLIRYSFERHVGQHTRDTRCFLLGLMHPETDYLNKFFHQKTNDDFVLPKGFFPFLGERYSSVSVFCKKPAFLQTFDGAENAHSGNAHLSGHVAHTGTVPVGQALYTPHVVQLRISHHFLVRIGEPIGF